MRHGCRFTGYLRTGFANLGAVLKHGYPRGLLDLTIGPQIDSPGSLAASVLAFLEGEGRIEYLDLLELGTARADRPFQNGATSRRVWLHPDTYVHSCQQAREDTPL